MPDGSTPTARGGSLAQILDQLEDALSRDERGESFALLGRAKSAALDDEERSTRPMDVINDVAGYVDQLFGIADLLTSANQEELCDGTLIRLGYAIEGILKRARDRLTDAREVARG